MFTLFFLCVYVCMHVFMYMYICVYMYMYSVYACVCVCIFFKLHFHVLQIFDCIFFLPSCISYYNTVKRLWVHQAQVRVLSRPFSYTVVNFSKNSQSVMEIFCKVPQIPIHKFQLVYFVANTVLH